MKLVSFRREARDSFGAVVDGGVVDLAAQLGGRHASLKAALQADALEQLQALARSSRPDLALEGLEFQPVIPDAGKIICVGLNYAPHIAESGRDMPKYPSLFVRFPDSQIGHGQPLVRPRVSERFDFEGELAFVIGRRARHVSQAAALEHVAGYTCFNDGSVRDWQRHTHQFTPGKNFWHSGAMGPWLVTADAIPDPAALTLVTRLNGQEMQRASTGDLVFGIPQLIAYISTFTELEPGDVIATGTPGGVGLYRDPPVFMAAGDVVEVEISRIGVLRNTVIDEKNA